MVFDLGTVHVLTGASAGVLAALLFQPKLSWKLVVTILLCGESAAYFFVGPVTAVFFAHPEDWFGAAGFLTGLVGAPFTAGLIGLFTDFRAKPWKVVYRLLRIRGIDDEPPGPPDEH